MVLMEQSNPDEVKASERRLADVTIGALQPWSGPIASSDYEPTWPEASRRHTTRIRGALGQRALRLEHVGNASDRDLYAGAKRELASREWTYAQRYADAKTEVIATIMARAEAVSTVSDSTS